MARKPRIEFPEATYHIMCRGNQRRLVFLGDEDRCGFLDTVEEIVWSAQDGDISCRHGRIGRLFQGRYKVLLADEDPDCLGTVANSMHLNPAWLHAEGLLKVSGVEDDAKGLLDLRKSAPGKQVLARLIRNRTCVSNGWITERLDIGRATHHLPLTS